MEKVRVMRVLVYEGTREWVEKTLKFSCTALNGTTVVVPRNECMIKSAIVGTFPEIMDADFKPIMTYEEISKQNEEKRKEDVGGNFDK